MGWRATAGGAGMRRAKQAASDASDGKNEQLRLLCEEFRRRVADQSTLEAVGTEREVIAALGKGQVRRCGRRVAVCR